MNPLLFVYGSLRSDARGSMFHLLAREATFLGRARVRGLLFRLAGYPGCVPMPDGDAWVHGELYRLERPAVVLAVLDEYEGCGPRDPRPHAFERVEVDVATGTAVERAWVYAYRGATGHRRRILSGDFFSDCD